MNLHLRFALGFVALAALAPACSAEAPETAVSEDAELRALLPGEILGSLGPGQTSAPVAYTSPPRYRAFSFSGTAGDAVEAWVRSEDGDALAFLTNAQFKSLSRNDDASPDTTDARLVTTLPSTGTYYVVFRERDMEPATFTVSLTKQPAPPPTPGSACTTLDEITKRPCGTCGIQEALCLDRPDGTLVWSDYAACWGEVPGGCVPGTQESAPCGNCGTAVRTCTPYCAWSTSTCSEPAGACAPGSTDLTSAGCTGGTTRERTCSAACTWGNFSATCVAR
jgi:hypothetical protein